jgi:site-specific recombinase XerD
VATIRKRGGRANALKADPIGKLGVARLGVEDVDKWIARRRKQGKGEGTIRNQLQVLRSALRQAQRWGWIADNPATEAELKRRKQSSE